MQKVFSSSPTAYKGTPRGEKTLRQRKKYNFKLEYTSRESPLCQCNKVIVFSFRFAPNPPKRYCVLCCCVLLYIKYLVD